MIGIFKIFDRSKKVTIEKKCTTGFKEISSYIFKKTPQNTILLNVYIFVIINKRR